MLPLGDVNINCRPVVADVFLVGQDLVHHPACPVAAKVGLYALPIEIGRDPGHRLSVHDEPPLDFTHDLDLLGGPGARTTRSVCRLLCSPRASSAFRSPFSPIRTRRSPKPAGPPCRYPSSIRRHCPAKTLTDSSRLYSPAIARFTLFTMVATGLPSFLNCTEMILGNTGPECSRGGRYIRNRQIHRHPETGPND